uniref:Uncharacterized protein n=1 Tax=Apteryx owenii TaxID=8824 RepID=A0A8B9NVX2_APTOW
WPLPPGRSRWRCGGSGADEPPRTACIAAKLEPLSEEERDRAGLNPWPRATSGCTIFLGFTSNLISSGVRETIRYLVQHNMVRWWTSRTRR